MSRKILIITAGFYPHQGPRSFRATELAKELVLQGHEVTVLTHPHESHSTFSRSTGIRIHNFQSKKWKGISIKGSASEIFLRRAIRRALDLFFHYPDIQYYFLVQAYLRTIRFHYDSLISIAVPHPIHWGVASIWRIKKESNPAKVWIADCGDPFMYAKHDTFIKFKYFNYFENKFLRTSDYIAVPFVEMIDLFNQEYRSKFKVIPQGFKFDKFSLPLYKPNSIPTFIYAGTVMPGSRDPFSLVDFLLDQGLDFKFIVYTHQKNWFSRYGKELGRSIFLHDYIPREELIIELAKADFLVNVNTDMINGKVNAIPTKLIDYHFSKRPVLSYQQSDLPKDIVLEFMAGVYTHAYVDPDIDRYRIENVVRKFLDLMP